MKSRTMTSIPASLLPELPQGCTEFDRMANELFSDTSENIAAAVDRIAEWQSRENIAAEVEISAMLVNIIQRESEFINGVSGNEALSEDSLKVMLGMIIHRLVTTVANQCPRHANFSTIDPAKAQGLPSLLVDIHDGWSLGKLPELSVLQFASAQALHWLKVNYWERQKEGLKHAIGTMKSKLHYPGESRANLRATLKVELEGHCTVMEKMFSPSARIHYSEHRNEPGMSLMLQKWNRARIDLFKVILYLSLSSPEDLVSIIVDDGLLAEVDPSVLEGGCRLASAKDSAWKFTIMELSIHMPRLPAMLLASILKQIKSTFSDRDSFETNKQTVVASHSGTHVIEERQKTLKRLTSWFHWLLGKRVSRGANRKRTRRLKMRDNDVPHLELLNISVRKFLTVDLEKEFSGELLRVCLEASVLGIPLLEFEPGIAVKLLGCNLQSPRKWLTQGAHASLGTATTGDSFHNSSTPSSVPGESSFKTKLEKSS